ncbi:MAG: uroporphyrinogen decarboxylase family protein [Anaerolineales bacterium]
MNHTERLKQALRGERVTPPLRALWRHFPVDDQDPQCLAEATLLWQRTFDWDLVKVTPASSFCLKDWGAQDSWRGNPEGTREYTHFVIRHPQDWERLPLLSPVEKEAPHLYAQRLTLRLVRQALGEDVPILQTVFSPLAQAKNLAGAERLLVHLRRFPQAVLKGLETITRTTRRFIEACLEEGSIDGVFYAVQHAQAALLSEEEYHRFGRPYDLQILEAARPLWCNMLHLHGQEIYAELFYDYPVQILNWHDRETAPSLKEAAKRFPGLLCGGVSRSRLVYGTPSEVREEAQEALAQVGGERLMLSTGCVVPIIAPWGNLLSLARFSS